MDRYIQPRLLKLDKLDAARRQIESAIWLWFLDSDVVSVQTLAASAQSLLHELADRWGVTLPVAAPSFSPDFQDSNPAEAETAAEYFEEAKKDERYTLSETLIELYLFDTVMAYSSLVDHYRASALMSTFVVRFSVQRQDLFAPGAFDLLEEMVSKSFNRNRLEQLSKIEFLEEFFGFLKQPPA